MCIYVCICVYIHVYEGGYRCDMYAYTCGGQRLTLKIPCEALSSLLDFKYLKITLLVVVMVLVGKVMGDCHIL